MDWLTISLLGIFVFAFGVQVGFKWRQYLFDVQWPSVERALVGLFDLLKQYEEKIKGLEKKE